MSITLKNRVRANTYSAATGVISLAGIPVGYKDFSSIGANNQTYYVIKDSTNWEIGKGTLTSNGNYDIHFVPNNANRGQKISSTGVVSTYSLVYTTAGAYLSGVLAQNGDIHFVPYDAVRGQKISSAGVVSTYSLVYTSSGAYWGGVLAPNGDVNFVPYNAIVGQKVSNSGVVSTYSLV
jgi:hypothetical protein